MNLDQVADRLRQLPPALPQPADRFDRVRRRVRRRQLRLAGASAVGMVAVAAATVGVLAHHSSGGVAIDRGPAATTSRLPAHGPSAPPAPPSPAPPAPATGGPWKVNAHGQTYGIETETGTPDLVAVIATDGRHGYAYATQLEGPRPTSPADALRQEREDPNGYDVPVYESDGTTRIGHFHVG
jgi:hypothetical protein